MFYLSWNNIGTSASAVIRIQNWTFVIICRYASIWRGLYIEGQIFYFDSNRLRFVCLVFFFAFCSSFDKYDSVWIWETSNDWNNLAATSLTWKPFISNEDHLQRMTCLLLYWGQDHVLSDTILLQIWHPCKQMNHFFPFWCVASACSIRHFLLVAFFFFTATWSIKIMQHPSCSSSCWWCHPFPSKKMRKSFKILFAAESVRKNNVQNSVCQREIGPYSTPR